MTREELEQVTEMGYVLRLYVEPGKVCPVCGSGEIHQPMQTMDMPMWQKCLRCGRQATSDEWE